MVRLTTSDGDCREIARHQDGVYAVAVRADGAVVSGGGDGVVRLTTVDSDSCEIARHQGRVRAVAVWSDGAVVSGGGDGVVRLTTSDGDCREIARHQDGVYAVAVRADGAVVSGGDDGLVKVSLPGREACSQWYAGAAVRVLAAGPLGDLAIGCGRSRLFYLPAGTDFDHVLAIATPADVKALAVVPPAAGRPTRIAVGHELGLTFYRVETVFWPALRGSVVKPPVTIS